MKKTFMLGCGILLILSIAGCAPGPNTLAGTGDPEGGTAGFWLGLWHGFTSLFTFIVSLFSDKVNVYEVHNNGSWYNFGFIFGVSAFFGGGGSSGRAARRWKK